MIGYILRSMDARQAAFHASRIGEQVAVDSGGDVPAVNLAVGNYLYGEGFSDFSCAVGDRQVVVKVTITDPARSKVLTALGIKSTRTTRRGIAVFPSVSSSRGGTS